MQHVEYETVEYENQFDHRTKYRGPPTRELEAAWHALYNCKLIGDLQSSTPVDVRHRPWSFHPARENGFAQPQRRNRLLEIVRIRTRLLGSAWGLPSTALPGNLLLDHIVCIRTNYAHQNFIRQYTWGGYYARHPERVDVPAAIGLDSEVGRRMHVDHCLESIRIALMCHGDITPVGLVRLDDEAPMGGRPDFSPLRKCVKFDGLVRYMQSNGE